MKPLAGTKLAVGLVALLCAGEALAASPSPLGLTNGPLLEGAELTEGPLLGLTLGATRASKQGPTLGAGQLSARYGGAWLEAGLAWSSQVEEGALAPGLLRLQLKHRALREDGLSLALTLPVDLELDEASPCWGATHPTLTTALQGRRAALRLMGGLTIGPCATRGVIEDLRYGAGLTVELHSDQLFFLADVLGQRRPFEAQGLSIGGGLRWLWRSGWALSLEGRGAALERDDLPMAWAGVTLSWQPVRFDLDEDGLGDDVDRCPRRPEDHDGFEDEDGCPDVDNDGDRILDAVDRCPNRAETRNRRLDHDGCPDVGDRDQDGHLDDVDGCPNHAEDFDGFEDEDGCPELDNDGDGVPDKEDACLWVAEDVDGFEDGDGCPDLDNDGDGIPDEEDPEPNVPAPAPVDLAAPSGSLASQATSLPASLPASQATSLPASLPASQATSLPASLPASQATSLPASPPTSSPTSSPAPQATSSPTPSPASSPTSQPTSSPTSQPTPLLSP